MNGRSSIARRTNDAYSPERYRGYRSMWAKVIMRAAYDYALWKDSKEFRLKCWARDAERWMFADNKLMNGFLSICEILNVDGERIRHYARNLTRDQVKKLEFMERVGRDPLRLALGLEEVDEKELLAVIADEDILCEGHGQGR